MDLLKAQMISASGLKAQGARLRIIAENIANAHSTAKEPGGAPYRRKVVKFDNFLHEQMKVPMVRVGSIERDTSDFPSEYKPGHPAADERGYVLLPNVNTMLELTDMQEAQRSYEANMKAVQAARDMMKSTLDLLR